MRNVSVVRFSKFSTIELSLSQRRSGDKINVFIKILHGLGTVYITNFQFRLLTKMSKHRIWPGIFLEGPYFVKGTFRQSRLVSYRERFCGKITSINVIPRDNVDISQSPRLLSRFAPKNCSLHLEKILSFYFSLPNTETQTSNCAISSSLCLKVFAEINHSDCNHWESV